MTPEGGEMFSERRRALCHALALVWVAAVVSTWYAPALADESQAERRERIDRLTPAEKQELWEHQDRFAKLDRAEQDRLRGLSHELEKDPQGPELRRVMQRYYDWLKTLPPYQRAQLLELPPEQRAKKVQDMQAEQARRASRTAAWGELTRREWRAGDKAGTLDKSSNRLDPVDVEGPFAWRETYAKNHASQMLERLPDQRERVKKGLEREPDPVRRQELIGWIWLWWAIDNRGKLPSLTDQELADLRSRLSPKTRKRLQSLSPDEQRQMVSGLFTSFMLQQSAARHTGLPLSMATEEQLGRFFERELTAEQRDKLASLSGEEMQRTLWRWYVAWKLRQLPPPRSGRDRRSGGSMSRTGNPAAPLSPDSSNSPPRSGHKAMPPAEEASSGDSRPTGRAPAEEPPVKKSKDKAARAKGPAKPPPADASD